MRAWLTGKFSGCRYMVVLSEYGAKTAIRPPTTSKWNACMHLFYQHVITSDRNGRSADQYLFINYRNSRLGSICSKAEAKLEKEDKLQKRPRTRVDHLEADAEKRSRKSLAFQRSSCPFKAFCPFKVSTALKWCEICEIWIGTRSGIQSLQPRAIQLIEISTQEGELVPPPRLKFVNV